MLGIMWDELIDEYGVSEQTMQVVTDINGYNEQTMYDILFAVAGETSFSWEEEE